jgi:hypothetical protein
MTAWLVVYQSAFIDAERLSILAEPMHVIHYAYFHGQKIENDTSLPYDMCKLEVDYIYTCSGCKAYNVV